MRDKIASILAIMCADSSADVVGVIATSEPLSNQGESDNLQYQE